MTQPLGRTNKVYPHIWLRPLLPDPAYGCHYEEFVDICLAAHAPLDITANPAWWGNAFRGAEAEFIAFGGRDIETAQDENHAADLVQAHLLQVLSSLGREHLEMYGLRIRRALEEFQIRGALSALESARSEGMLRYFALKAEGPAMAVRSVWQFHDAFEVIFCPRHPAKEADWIALREVARERRVGMVANSVLSWETGVAVSELGASAGEIVAHYATDSPILLSVRSAAEVDAALRLEAMPHPDTIEKAAQLNSDPESWQTLLTDEREWVRKAAERRLA